MADNTLKFRAVLEDKVSAGLDQIRTKADMVGGKGTSASLFGNIGAKAAASALGMVEQAVGGLATFMEGTIAKASDLNETISKSGVVFGSSAKSVEEWGKTAATSMGMSENAAIGAAASIGNLLLSTGTAPEKIAPMSTAIVKLAADLASFNNIPMDEALAKLQSGLVGQERPLRELGVAISAASVDAEALALGFVKVNGQFTEGQKVQARYSLIFKQTATAQGDFARTSDQLANSQRIANAEWEDAQAAIGKKFLPIALELTRWMATEGIPLFLQFVDVLGKVGDAAGFVASRLNDLAGAHKAASDPVFGLGEDFLGLGSALKGAGDFFHSMTTDVLDWTGIVKKGAESAAFMASAVKDDMVQPMVEAKPKIRDAGYSIGGYVELIGRKAGTAAEQVAAAWKSITSSTTTALNDLRSAGADMASALYDPIIARAELATARRDAAETKAKIRSGQLHKQELADAQQHLIELDKTMFSLEADLASYGDKSAKNVLKHQIDVLTHTKNLTTEQKAKLAELKRAYAAAEAAAISMSATLRGLDYMANKTKDDIYSATTAGGSSKGKVTGKAGGGPVSPGNVYDVGEKGQERLIMFPGGGGFVLPNTSGGSSGAGGGSATINVNFHSLVPPTTAQMQGIAQKIAPELVREFRRIGVSF